LFSFNRNDPNAGVRMNDPRPEPRVTDAATGNAARDGYTRLSQADRETGQRQPLGESADTRFIPQER
jgi:hypothetical protein